MRDDEAAWCMTQFINGRSGHALAREFDRQRGRVNSELMRFYEKYGSSGPEHLHIKEYAARRDAYFRDALEAYLANGGQVTKPYTVRYTAMVYHRARAEYAWWLRSQGLTYRAIATRMGATIEAARHLVFKQECRLP